MHNHTTFFLFFHCQPISLQDLQHFIMARLDFMKNMNIIESARNVNIELQFKSFKNGISFFQNNYNMSSQGCQEHNILLFILPHLLPF
jgi:hypothetical protein